MPSVSLSSVPRLKSFVLLLSITEAVLEGSTVIMERKVCSETELPLLNNSPMNMPNLKPGSSAVSSILLKPKKKAKKRKYREE